MPRRKALDGETIVSLVMQDEKEKIWVDRYMHCLLHSEKVRLDMFRESLIIGQEVVRQQYRDAQAEYKVSKDPRYPYIQSGATQEELDHFWPKCDALFVSYPETTHDKCMHFLMCTFGVQLISQREFTRHEQRMRGPLRVYGNRTAMTILQSQGYVKRPFNPADFPSGPYEYILKWVGKSFQFADETGAKRFKVESVYTTTDRRVYAISGQSGGTRELSEKELNMMLYDQPIPEID